MANASSIKVMLRRTDEYVRAQTMFLHRLIEMPYAPVVGMELRWYDRDEIYTVDHLALDMDSGILECVVKDEQRPPSNKYPVDEAVDNTNYALESGWKIESIDFHPEERAMLVKSGLKEEKWEEESRGNRQ